MNTLYLSLGSNIEPSFLYLQKAASLLKTQFQIERCSGLYRTSARDDFQQADFLNLCVKCQTQLDDSYDVLSITQKIENEIGRQKVADRPKGPRTIDIDIILFGDKVMQSERLTIPHLCWRERNFVLIPLLEIGKELADKYPIQDWIKKNESDGSQKIEYLGEFHF